VKERKMCRWIETKLTKTLSSLNEGETGKIVKIRGKAVELCYLWEQGLIVGKNVSIDYSTIKPEDLSIKVKTGNKILEIQKRLAMNISVQVSRVHDEKQIPKIEKEFVHVYYNR
jgi:Fe2+ transport system protein FeoA